MERAAIRIIRNRASDGPSADRAVAHARQFDTDVWRDAKRDARSALAASPAPAPAAGVEGWKLVPIEPPFSMLIEGRDAIIGADDDLPEFISTDHARECYRAMLDVAPSPKAGETG